MENGDAFNGAFGVSCTENERTTEKTIPRSQTKAFCLIQGERWLWPSAKRWNEQGKEVRQEDVSCKQLPMKKAGQRQGLKETEDSQDLTNRHLSDLRIMAPVNSSCSF